MEGATVGSTVLRGAGESTTLLSTNLLIEELLLLRKVHLLRDHVGSRSDGLEDDLTRLLAWLNGTRSTVLESLSFGKILNVFSLIGIHFNIIIRNQNPLFSIDLVLSLELGSHLLPRFVVIDGVKASSKPPLHQTGVMRITDRRRESRVPELTPVLSGWI